MIYKISSIKDMTEFEQCSVAEIANFQWNSKQTPKAIGKMGRTDEGFAVEMTCYEESPKAEFLSHLDPVYRDSAMETFFAFVPPNSLRPNLEDFYINIEFNSNGAVYAAYGFGRENRTKFTDQQINQLKLEIKKEKDYWQGTFVLPFSLVTKLYKEEYDLWINFYKISESKEIEHYGSFSKIDSETPNFHRPDCFAKTKIA